MTVAEVILKLYQFDQDALVVLQVGGDGAIHTDQVRAIEVMHPSGSVVVISGERL
jgi:hypothetical protein